LTRYVAAGEGQRLAVYNSVTPLEDSPAPMTAEPSAAAHS
jgi:hypothetical protein